MTALRAFEAVARHLSYAVAAAELNVTPAAVGQLIRNLESTLDVELFYRSTSGATRLTLTDAARAAIPDIQGGFEALSTGVERMRAYKNRVAVTITVPSAFADKWLLHRLEGFQKKHPYYDLHIDTRNQLVDFKSERADVGIRYGAGTWPPLSSTLLIRDEFFPVCSPLLLKNAPIAEPADLANHQLIHDASMDSTGSFPTWRSWLRKSGAKDVDSDRGLRINDSAAAIQAAIAGNGVALGRTTLVERDLADGRLVRLFDYAEPCELAYFVVFQEKDSNAPQVVAFKEWVISEASTRIKH